MSTVPPTMKAAVVRETGDASALKVENDFPTPTLGANQVIVKNSFAGINSIDTYHRKGLYARDLPFVGGQEGGGTVAAVSDEATAAGIKVGDRVAIPSLAPTPNTQPCLSENCCLFQTTSSWMSPQRVSFKV